MERRMDPVVLWARAGLLTLVAVLLGAAGHVSADGLLPGPGVLALLLLVGAVPAAALLSRPASALRVVVLLVLGQAGVHAVLTATGGHAADGSGAAHPGAAHAGGGALHGAVTDGAPGALPLVDGRRVGSLRDAHETGAAQHVAASDVPLRDLLDDLLGHLVSDLSDHAPMMAVHLAAAVLVGLWLAVGERSLWTLVALASSALARPLLLAVAALRACSAPSVPPVPLPAAAPLPRLPDLLARSVVRRGPPLLAA